MGDDVREVRGPWQVRGGLWLLLRRDAESTGSFEWKSSDCDLSLEESCGLGIQDRL